MMESSGRANRARAPGADIDDEDAGQEKVLVKGAVGRLPMQITPRATAPSQQVDECSP